jgi:hypothetical protein
MPFWNFLEDKAKQGQIASIDKVKIEILKGEDNLSEWFNRLFEVHCLSTQNSSTFAVYGSIVQHINASNRYSTIAKDEFMQASNADTWLLAHCLSKQKEGKSITLVTGEVSNSNIKKRVPIPNVCEDFNINYCNCFELIKALNFRFK